MTQLHLRKDGMKAFSHQGSKLNEIRAALHGDCDILSGRIRQSIRYLTQVTHYDTRDLEIIKRRCDEIDDYNFNMRQYVRSFFAYAEAMIYHDKQYALMLPQNHYTFTPKEHDIANEEGSSSRISFIDNFKYSMKFLRKAFDVSYTLDTSSRAYTGFLFGVSVRDRLMHPKKIEDVNPPDYDEYGKFADGVGWYYEQTSNLLELVVGQLQNARQV